MTAACFHKLDLSFSLVRDNPGCFLAVHPEKGLILTRENGHKATNALVASYVLEKFDNALKLDPQSVEYPRKKTIKSLQTRIIKYFASEDEELLVALIRTYLYHIKLRLKALPPEIEHLGRISLALQKLFLTLHVFWRWMLFKG